MQSTIKDWDTYFMTMCYLVAMKSKDPSTHSGCVITSVDHRILSTGYNWLPRGMEVDNEGLRIGEEKNAWMSHAERNAIFNAAATGTALQGSTLYVNWMPCYDCAVGIVNSKIHRVVVHKEGDALYRKIRGASAWGDSQERAREAFKAGMVRLDVRSIQLPEQLLVCYGGSELGMDSLNDLIE